jgi:hypothetical protein
MTKSKLAARAIIALVALLGAGCTTAPLSVEVSGEVSKSLTSLGEMQSLARKRIDEAKFLIPHLSGKEDKIAASPSELIAYRSGDGNAKFTTDSLKFMNLVCGELKFGEVAEGLTSITDLNKRIGKLAEPPKDTFVGISKAVRRDEKVLKDLSELKSFNERLNAQLRDKASADEKLSQEGKDCTGIVKSALARGFVGAQPAGGGVSATSVLSVFETAVALVKTIYGIKESALRDSALRAFANAYEEDILYSLMLLDGRMNRLSIGSAAKPKEIFAIPVDPSKNRLISMLEQHQSAMVQRGFIIFSELSNNSSLSNLERLRASEAIGTAIGEALSIDPKGGLELTSALTKLWVSYFSALKTGSESKAESLDSLIDAEAGLSGLLAKFNAFKKARDEL